MPNDLLDLLGRNVDTSFWIISPNGKERLTFSQDINKTTIFREQKIAQLRKDFFFDNNSRIKYGDDSIDYPIIDALCDKITGSIPENPFFDSFSEDIKLDSIYEVRDFEVDRKIVLDKSNDLPLVNGIILDLDENEGFSYTYQNGIGWDAFVTKNIMNTYNKYLESDIPKDKWNLDTSDLDMEIHDIVEETFIQLNGAAEKTIRGLYVIIDNQVYYFSVEAYKELCDAANQEQAQGALEVTTSKGLYQLNHHLLSDNTFENTLELIKTNVDLANKPHVDLTDERNLGLDIKSFVAKLFDGSEEPIKILESSLKPENKRTFS